MAFPSAITPNVALLKSPANWVLVAVVLFIATVCLHLAVVSFGLPTSEK